MKYFKHMVDAHRDELVEELMLKFGAEAYTIWFVTAELVGKVVKLLPDGTVCTKIEADPRVFENSTKIPQKKLAEVYTWIARRTKGEKLSFKKRKGLWVIDFRKVLEFKDEYTETLIREARETRELVGSNSVATRKGVDSSTLPIREGGDVSKGGGTGGEPARVWARRIMASWQRLTQAPSYSPKLSHIRD
mgnify:FL=1